MKAVLAVLCLAVVASAMAPLKESEYQFLFTRFIAEHNKAYTTNEFFNRFNIFKNNVDYIRIQNAMNNSHTLGMNQFGDLTAHEFKTDVVGGCFKGASAAAEVATPIGLHRIRDPASVDWTAQGKVQKVKNQAQCGSCWAFSAIGALESAVAIAGGALQDLSEQQLVDCAGSEGNQGCNGGLMNQAYDYLIKFGGAVPTSKYAYTARDGACKAKTADVVVKVASHAELPADENALGDALQKGPVAVAIEADQSVFQFYKSGVIENGCGANLDHGVLATGYVADSNKGYWIIKNSWGTSWGNQGYVNIRAFKNMCGIKGNGWNSVPTPAQ